MANDDRRPRALVINGPNLNLLGERQPDLYGRRTLDDINRDLDALAHDFGWDASFVQSNHEGELIDVIHAERKTVDGVIINAGAYTHTSIAIADALAMVPAPVVEVHLTNVHAREARRHVSHLSALASAIIVGAGPVGYELALRYLASTRSAAR